jgi:hypothetical protein
MSNVELIDYLKNNYLYDKETGRFIVLKSRGFFDGKDGKNIGKPAGWQQKNGYLRMSIKGKFYQAHRLVWLLFNGDMPKNYIDHINGQKNDNRIENLRDVTQQENTQNIKTARKNNKSGYLGVTKNKNLYQASIWVNGNNKKIGLYKTGIEAHQAYLKEKSILHEGFVN